jgi:hypothetical protein
MAEKNIWKVWLRRNLLTEAVENDYIAEVSTAGNTLRNSDVAARIVAGRSELRQETIESILRERDEIVLEALIGGTAVQDEVIRVAPRVSGAWVGLSHGFDPEAHKITINAAPTAKMRAALETVQVEILGEKNSGAYIGLVTDLSRNKADGIITPEEDLLATGDKLKVDPEGEAGLGVFFTDPGGIDHPLTHKLSENTPKKLLFRVPALTPGTYILKVLTRFSNSKVLLKEKRELIYEFPLTVPQVPGP